jgi:hypothetical protein
MLTASSRLGIDSMTSTQRMMNVSTDWPNRPPTAPNPPATRPRVAPTIRPMAVDTTPYTRDCRAPYTICVHMSEPNRSSPSQWSADGPGTLVGVTCPDHSAEPGAYGVRSGAKTATRTNTATMIAPAMALGLRRTRRNAPRQRLTP